MSTWSDAVSAAQKALGKDGKLPKPRVDPASMYPIVIKAMDAFNKSREGLEKTLLDYENAFSQSKNTFKQYADMVDGADFGLNEDDEECKKKMAAASAILLKALKEMQEGCDKNIDNLSKLDRFVTDLQRLKDVKL
jgi:hypothetical protein